MINFIIYNLLALPTIHKYRTWVNYNNNNGQAITTAIANYCGPRSIKIIKHYSNI